MFARKVLRQIFRPVLKERQRDKLLYDLHLSARALRREPPSAARDLGLEAISVAVRVLG